MNKKIIIFIVLGFILMLAALGWRQLRSVPTRAEHTGQLQKITIGNIGEYSIFNIIAKEKGYFKDNGLDATVIEYDAGPAAVKALLEGQVDISIAAEFVGVSNMFDHRQLRIITQTSKHKVFYMVAKTASGIRMPSDLQGKKIGVTKKSAGEIYLNRFLIFNNIKPTDVIIFDLSPTQMISQLGSGEIDAALIFDPHAYNLKKSGGDAFIVWPAQGEENTFSLAYSTDNFIKKNPDSIKRYIRALLEAEQFSRQYPQEAQDLMVRILRYDPAYVRYMWTNFIFTNRLDAELLLTMEDRARWVIRHETNSTKIVPNYLEYIHFDALAAAKPEAVSVIR